jgi:hypothetical protein
MGREDQRWTTLVLGVTDGHAACQGGYNLDTVTTFATEAALVPADRPEDSRFDTVARVAAVTALTPSHRGERRTCGRTRRDFVLLLCHNSWATSLISCVVAAVDSADARRWSYTRV